MMLDKAKRLFDEYDGSRFYMSRNDVEEQYACMRVPKSTESKWLEDLTVEKLKRLHSAGNWEVLNFLVHHANYRHLDDIASVAPFGRFWEKAAFLEELLKYLCGCIGIYENSRLIVQCNTLLSHASSLKRRVRADASISRVRQIIHDAKQLKLKLQMG